jgi:metal-responsive CopG/Arc/MetJ family transcriptional regulator
MVMARRQTLVQFTDDLLASLDEFAVRSGRSRSELIRDAVEQYLHEQREVEIDEAIAEGYSRIPPPDPAEAYADARRLVAEEPW